MPADGRDVSPTSRHVHDVAPEAEAEAEAEIRSISSSSPSAGPDTPAINSGTEPQASAKAGTLQEVKGVFEFWRVELDKPRATLDGKRTARIRARLAEGFTVAQLCKAIRGAKKDPFLMGRDARAARVFDGLETLLRDAAQVERLIALDEGSSWKSNGAAQEGHWL